MLCFLVRVSVLVCVHELFTSLWVLFREYSETSEQWTHWGHAGLLSIVERLSPSQTFTLATLPIFERCPLLFFYFQTYFEISCPAVTLQPTS